MKIKYVFPLISIVALASCGITKEETTTIETTTETTANTTTETTINTTTETTNEIELSYRVLPDKVNNYYKDVDITLEGDAFINSLTKVISKNYQKYSYSAAWDIIKEADEDPYNKDNIVCIYTGLSIPKSGQGSTWNREHTWPKSHGFDSESNPAYTDCHHLTATQNQANNTRGDLDFDEVENITGKVLSDGYGNSWITNYCYEPRDEAKGDCARALFYMMARYDDSTLDLEIVDKIPTSTSSTIGKIGKLSTLLKWHYQDPVSDEEIRRNEVIYSYQANRNPFIDHPEWVNLAFDSNYENLSINKEKVYNIIQEIDSLPSLITLENEDDVYSIYNKVMALNAQEKLYVSNYQALSSAKYQIDYLKGNMADDDASKTFDFSTCNLKTTSYEKNKNVEVNGAQFYLSSCFGDNGDIRIGYNSKKSGNAVSLTTLGVNGTGAYLKANFSTVDLVGITIESITPPSRVDKVYIIGVNNDSYTVLYSGTASNKVEAKFEKFSGEFIIAITGTNPVLYLSKMYLYTA